MLSSNSTSITASTSASTAVVGVGNGKTKKDKEKDKIGEEGKRVEGQGQGKGGKKESVLDFVVRGDRERVELLEGWKSKLTHLLLPAIESYTSNGADDLDDLQYSYSSHSTLPYPTHLHQNSPPSSTPLPPPPFPQRNKPTT